MLENCDNFREKKTNLTNYYNSKISAENINPIIKLLRRISLNFLNLTTFYGPE